jgi:hypothetical protein
MHHWHLFLSTRGLLPCQLPWLIHSSSSASSVVSCDPPLRILYTDLYRGSLEVSPVVASDQARSSHKLPTLILSISSYCKTLYNALLSELLLTDHMREKNCYNKLYTWDNVGHAATGIHTPPSTFNFQRSTFNLQGLMAILRAPLLFILSRASW